VGAILVVAFFVVPVAAAHLLAPGLATMLILAMAVGWASAVAGHWTAVHYDTSISDMIGLATVPASCWPGCWRRGAACSGAPGGVRWARQGSNGPGRRVAASPGRRDAAVHHDVRLVG